MLKTLFNENREIIGLEEIPMSKEQLITLLGTLNHCAAEYFDEFEDIDVEVMFRSLIYRIAGNNNIDFDKDVLGIAA